MQRRHFLSSAFALAAASTLPVARADQITGGQPWELDTASLPTLPTVRQGSLAFFNQHEFQTAEAIADRLIPADRWRKGLVEIDDYSQAQFGKPFLPLQGEQQDQVLRSFEKNAVKVGINQLASSLAGNLGIQAENAQSLITTVLKGGRGAVTVDSPTSRAMPRFAGKLSDQQIAATLSYIRNSWGNAAPEVTAIQVGEVREDRQLPAQLSADGTSR